MAPQIIHRHAGDATEQVHLHPTYAESGPQSRLHHCPARHPPPTGKVSGVQPSQIVNLPAGYMYSNITLPWTEFFNDEETEHDTDFDPDMLTDEG